MYRRYDDDDDDDDYDDDDDDDYDDDDDDDYDDDDDDDNFIFHHVEGPHGRGAYLAGCCQDIGDSTGQMFSIFCLVLLYKIKSHTSKHVGSMYWHQIKTFSASLAL